MLAYSEHVLQHIIKIYKKNIGGFSMTKDLFENVSMILKESVEKILSENNTVNLGLCGGRSIAGILKILKKEDIDWSKIHIFIVDERMVPITSDDSNFKLIKNELSNIIPENNFHPFIMNDSKDDYGLSNYEDVIKKHGNSYDIVVLSSGEDGHIGALYPNHHSVRNESEYLIYMDDSPKPPSKRMSISKEFLLKSNIAILIFKGDIKKNAYLNFLNEDFDIESCPAKIVKDIKESYILTDIKLKTVGE